MSTIDADRHGLETIARRWNPVSMRRGENAAEAMDAINACAADALSILIDLEQYIPLLWNALRCLPADIDAILALSGVERERSLSTDQARRMAVIATQMRSWRGAFRSLRAIVGAITGGPVIVLSWISLRTIVDVTTWAWVAMDVEDSDVTFVFLLGEGPSSVYDEAQVERHVARYARTALDETVYIPCFALTAWRDGMAGWGQAIGSLVSTEERGEYESLDIGPAVNPSSSTHRLTSPTESDPSPTRTWVTVWFKTVGADDDSSWRLLAASDAADPETSYALEVHVGNHNVRILRIDAGVETELLDVSSVIHDDPSDVGSWHRADLVLLREAAGVSLRAYIDHDPTVWCLDASPSPPDGTRVEILVENASFASGRLRVAAITAA